MGQRGPKPTPQKVLHLRGSWRGNRRGIVKNIDHKRPQRPQWLKDEAKTMWDFLCPRLYADGRLVETNRPALALLCSAWSDYVKAEMALQAQNEEVKKKYGPNATAIIVKTSSGAMTENPLLYTRKRAWDQVFKAAACFGLTPADIAGVRAVEKPSEDDEKAKFFKDIG